jgi:hypothetical protein
LSSSAWHKKAEESMLEGHPWCLDDNFCTFSEAGGLFFPNHFDLQTVSSVSHPAVQGIP